MVLVVEPPLGNGDRDQVTPYDSTYFHAGGEISSTAEGRYVSIYESLLVHPAHTDGFVDKGDPVVVSQLVGIALRSASSATDVITVETEGIWWLDVYAYDNLGWLGTINVGDMLYIDPVTALVSNDWEDIPFGHALGPVTAGTTALIAVKVHAFQIFYPGWAQVVLN